MAAHDFPAFENRLIDLGLKIDTVAAAALKHVGQSRMPEWSGGHVIVTSDFSQMDGFFGRFIIRTRHAKPVTWLIFELRDCFADQLNSETKYGFYGRLAQAAIDHLAANQPEAEDFRPLLRSILHAGFGELQQLRQTHDLPVSPPIIIHSIDAEGRQSRQQPGDGEKD